MSKWNCFAKCHKGKIKPDHVRGNTKLTLHQILQDKAIEEALKAQSVKKNNFTNIKDDNKVTSYPIF